MEKNKKGLTVEKHSSLANVKTRTMEVFGLTDIPLSMIPVPFYKLVQPGSTKVTMTDGNDALPGTFFMKDCGEAVNNLNFVILRAKRQVGEFTNSTGERQEIVTMGILGLNLDRSMSPFILRVPVSSFSNFGQLMSQVKERKMENAWEYPISATTEKREMEKNTDRGRQTVKFYIINFSLGKEQTSEDNSKIAQLAYDEFAPSLDRGQEEQILATEPETEEKELGKDLPF